MSIESSRERMLEDLIETERQLRVNAEKIARSYRKLMIDLAFRLDGERLEDLRRGAYPNLESWSTGDWQAFWRDYQPKNGREWKNREKHLEVVSQGRDEQLREAEAVVSPENVPNVQKNNSTPASQNGYDIPSMIRLIAEMPIPMQPPAAYRHHLDTGQSTLRYRRKLMALRLLAAGVSIRLEIDTIISRREGLGMRTNSVRKPLEELVESRLVATEVLHMTNPFETSLAVCCLTEEGRHLCNALGWTVVESESERLTRIYPEENKKDHILAVLTFTIHARLRGWKAEVLPVVNGVVQPDVRVEKGEEIWYVGIESNEFNPEKLVELAQLNNGKIALCALNEHGREKLLEACRESGITGVSNDLFSLAFVKEHLPRSLTLIGVDDLLWMCLKNA
jgi:hypothetical protein